MDDLLIKPKAEEFRAQQLAKIDVEALDVAAKFCEADKSNPDFVRKALAAKLVEEVQALRLDNQMSSALNEFSSNIVKECVPNGQLKPFPWNNLSLMTATGAKGSQVNYSQISCLLGQQALEGRRVPFMASGKTLPCFDPYDPAARAGGYVSQRFLTGLRPQEFYFHCMAGREGLIDTAVKTSRSGYLQRCLIKHLEGLVVQYDQTVRDHDGSIVMFQYGEDNIDVLESAFLEQFGFVLKNFEASKAKLLTGHEHLVSQKKMKKMMKYLDRARKHPEMYDPLSSRSGSSKLGHVSERFWEQLSLFCEKKKRSFVKRKIDPIEFKTLMFFKYRKSQVHPGEVVGLLAAQSVGEPSTQMTLNTFHAAGRNEANVTLGIPRLREVLMTASKQIATPSMTLHLNNPTSQEDAQHLMTKLYRLVLRELISGIVCNEVYLIEPHSQLGFRDYEIRIFLEHDVDLLLERYGVSVSRLTQVFNSVLAAQLQKTTANELNTPRSDIRVITSAADEPDDSGEGEDEEGPKRRKKRRDYSEESDEDESASDSLSDQDGEAVKEEGGKEKFSQDGGLDYAKKLFTCTIRTPASAKKLLFVPIVEQLADNLVVQHCPGITKTYLVKNKTDGKETFSLQTDGANFNSVLKYRSLFNENKIDCNDIGAVLAKYGVECARAAIIEQTDAVFQVYGINVSPRHLMLIADYMTFDGDFKPFNRIGLSVNSSPFQKMSFETTTAFLKEATLFGFYDNMRSPSARISLGQPNSGGTGAFDVRFNYAV